MNGKKTWSASCVARKEIFKQNAREEGKEKEKEKERVDEKEREDEEKVT
jgi:hypothetical protein